MSANTSADTRDQVATAQLVLRAGEKKYREGFIIQFVKSIYGGALLCFGCNCYLIAGSSPALAAADPGLLKLIGGLVFPIGLIMISLLGQELLTSTMMTGLVCTLKRRVPLWWYPAIMIVQLFGNLVGCLMYDAFLLNWSGEFASSTAYGAYVQTLATAKVVTPTAVQIFLRGIGCNVLVCIAVWLGTQARDGISKIISIYLPVFLFVACGFDHVIANMCFIPLAIIQGSPSISTGMYIYKSLLPSFAGNLLGAWLIAVPFTLFYLTGDSTHDAGSAQQHDMEANATFATVGKSSSATS